MDTNGPSIGYLAPHRPAHVYPDARSGRGVLGRRRHP
jgi:hypothetical protein